MKFCKITAFVLLVLVVIASCGKKATESDQVAIPVFDPPGGDYTAAQTIHISCATLEADIRYTLDGSTPTESSTLYAGNSGISIAQSTTIKARAYKEGWTASPVSSADYTIQQTVARPIFFPPAGTYSESQYVAITCSTPDATILYSIDGTAPALEYSAPVLISASCLLKAEAIKNGWTSSEVAEANYYIEEPSQNMLLVSGGTFHNGASNVTLSPFYIARYEVTQSEYLEVMDENPAVGYGEGANYPVYSINWFNAIEYCNRKSSEDGLTPCYSYAEYGTAVDTWPAGWDLTYTNHTNITCDWSADGYRLPTEMEWEFAARGGNLSNGYAYSGSDEIDAVAWYGGNASGQTHPKGEKNPNELALFDMSGNVYEFVWDMYGAYPSEDQTDPHGAAFHSQRIIRGGAWNEAPEYCTVSSRATQVPTDVYSYTGMRICRIAR